MAKIKIEGNRITVDMGLCENNSRVFEIVGRIPVGYQIWNIGENMGTHDYIPLCQCLHPEDKNDYSINPATLKAIRVTPEEWEKLNKARRYGITNLQAAAKALKSKRRGYMSDKKREFARITIDIFTKLS